MLGPSYTVFPCTCTQITLRQQVSLADISEATHKEPTPSPLQIKSRRQQPLVISESDDDQRVPDTVEKGAPGGEAVDLTSDAEPQSHDRGAAAAVRLSQGDC